MRAVAKLVMSKPTKSPFVESVSVACVGHIGTRVLQQTTESSLSSGVFEGLIISVSWHDYSKRFRQSKFS